MAQTAPPSRPNNAVSTMPAAAGEDELDDLYDYGAGMADIFAQVDTNMEPAKDTTATGAARREAIGSTANGQKKRKRGEGATDSLGIDEEIKIKIRVPRVKLDEALLLSEKGIPKLRQKVKKGLRLKGKGHEFSDVARMLAMYQLWLDDLFPKAKFADGLSIIEKLGHSRHMQVMRKQWIDDAKMGITTGSQPEDESQPDHVPETQAVPERQRSVQGVSGSQRQRTPPPPPVEEEDIYSATPGAQRVAKQNSAVVVAQDHPEPTALDRSSAANNDDDDDEDDDELDALFQAANHDKTNLSQRPLPQRDAPPANPVLDPTDKSHADDDYVDDDLDALLAEHEQPAAQEDSAAHTQRPSRDNPEEEASSLSAQPKSSRPPVDEPTFDDDMEALNELDVAW
ncbi:MAG: chromosome segregation in meiosis- protein [Lichina confinis]|nr:MAG: chromosome segregation in meiosis- protein [Lichina confinis]